MALKHFKPYTKSTRSTILIDRAGLWKGKPVKSIEVTPKSDEEKKLYDGALRRRQLRLILAGKMKPEEADELKSIFN